LVVAVEPVGHAPDNAQADAFKAGWIFFHGDCEVIFRRLKKLKSD
jgi:hypothetical protein